MNFPSIEEWVAPIIAQIPVPCTAAYQNRSGMQQLLIVRNGEIVSVGEFVSNFINNEQVSEELKIEFGERCARFIDNWRDTAPKLCWVPVPNSPKLQIGIV